MPSASTTKLPRPKSEEEWEDMVLDAMRIRWNDPNAFRYGRKGQSQNGVDIIGRRDSLTVAAQAKNCDSLSEQIIKSEIKKTEKLYVQLDELYFVISGNRDTKLQELIHGISIENKANGSFEIFIVYFDDVCNHLTCNLDLVKKYWYSFFDAVSQVLKKSILTSEDAFDIVMNLTEFKLLAKQIEKASSGEANLCFRIEEVPNLEAELGSIERSWKIAMSENHKSHLVTLWRFAIDVDNGSILFFSITDCTWISRDKWKGNGFS